MEAERRRLIDELAAHGREHDAGLEDRLRRLRNVETETAELMGVLVRALRARRLLELGTSNGYSTLWLGDAAQATGGTLVSVDIDPERTTLAAANVKRAGLQQTIELRSEDAAATLQACADETCDFVFLDAERPAYVGYWPDLVRVLARPGLLLVDNAISHAGELVEFTECVNEDRRVTAAVVPVGAGAMLVSRV